MAELFAEHSRDVDLTILGMQAPERAAAADYAERLESFAEAVGTVLLVYNAQPEEDLL